MHSRRQFVDTGARGADPTSRLVPARHLEGSPVEGPKNPAEQRAKQSTEELVPRRRRTPENRMQDQPQQETEHDTYDRPDAIVSAVREVWSEVQGK